MDVLNLSLGGPQIDPSADALSMALSNAAAAGVPSVVAAGNDFDTRGYGSITSPGTTVSAITVAATSTTSVFGVSGGSAVAAMPRSSPSPRCRRRGRASGPPSRGRRASSAPRPTASTGAAAASPPGAARSGRS